MTEKFPGSSLRPASLACAREVSSLVKMLESELRHYRMDDVKTPLFYWKTAAAQVEESHRATI